MTTPQLEWIIQGPLFDTTTGDIDARIAVDTFGNVYVAYQTFGTTSGNTSVGNYDIVVMKTNTNGVIQWVKQQSIFNTPLNDTTPTIAVGVSGNIYIAFLTLGTTSGNTNTGNNGDIAIMKMDNNGVVQWIKQQPTFNTTGGDSVPSIVVDTSENIYVAYSTTGTTSGNTNIGQDDLVVLKMDTNGVLLWVQQQAIFNTPVIEYAPSIAIDAGSNVYISYRTNGTTSGHTNIGSYDIAVLKMNTNGVVQWVRQQPTFNTTLYDIDPSIAVDVLGNAYITYYTSGTTSGNTNLGSNDIIIFKMDTNGILQWVRQQAPFNTPQLDTRPFIAVDTFSNVYVTYITFGTTSGNTLLGNSDTVVLKMNTHGVVQWITQQPNFNTNGGQFATAIAVDPLANIYVAYYTFGTSSGNTNVGQNDVVIFKLVQEPICLHADTLVPTNTEIKKISDIVANEYVYGIDNSLIKVEFNIKSGRTNKFYRIEKNALGINSPNEDTFIHGGHYIWYNSKEYKPRDLIKMGIKGIKIIKLENYVDVYSICAINRTFFKVMGELLVCAWGKEEWLESSKKKGRTYVAQ